MSEPRLQIGNISINQAVMFNPEKRHSSTGSTSLRNAANTVEFVLRRTKDQYGDIPYYLNLDVYWPPSRYACYLATKLDGSALDDGPLPLNQQIGPFEEDIYLTIKVCNSSCSPTASCPCYKTIYVPTPDCNQNERISFAGTSEAEPHINPPVYVQPNPTHSDEIVIYSSLPKTEYEILDVHGKKIVNSSFIGLQQSQTLHAPPGMYFLKYMDMNGQVSVVKIIKQ